MTMEGFSVEETVAMLKATLALLLLECFFACAGNVPAGAIEDAGFTLDAGITLDAGFTPACAATEACIQGNGVNVCRTRCQMDAGTPCSAGETCTRRIVCCSGTACTAALAYVCCPAPDC
jgi:hypothetical protein